MPEVVFVTGMHRSATSAFAGATLVVGAAAPLHMVQANIHNPKGYFEPEAVVSANDTVLAGIGRHWHDCRALALPDGLARAEIVDRFAQLLQDGFENADAHATADAPSMRTIKDPRISLLAPLWAEASAEAGMQPVFVVLLRDPVASAASIEARDGLSSEHSLALWLRHMLDAERNTRGQRRAILSAEAFVADPVGTLCEVEERLALRWPVPPAHARERLEEFVEADLLKSPANAPDTGLMVLARRTYSALLTLSRAGDVPGAHAPLDALAQEFEAICPEIHAQAVMFLTGAAVERKWHVDAIRRDVEGRIKAAEARSRTAAETEARLQAAEAELAAKTKELTEAAHARDAAQASIAENMALRMELARMRRRPLKLWRDLMRYKALTALSRPGLGLPDRTRARLGRSAAKRAPDRSIRHEVPSLASSAPAAAVVPAGASGCAARLGGDVRRDPARRDILVVSHDASRTGAPILAWNLVKELSRSYNVTTLCMGGGPLIASFAEHSVAVWQAGTPTGEGAFYSDILRDMSPEGGFAFGIVNSIEARHMLLPLHLTQVTCVALLHEFASNTRPFTAFGDAARWADHMVFSTNLTLDNAVATNFLARNRNLHVIAQGRCSVPGLAGRAADEGERKRLRNLLCPPGRDGRRFIVMGAGSVCYRKGVDLFVDLAARTLARPEGRDALFVWVGGGFKPNSDEYSGFLVDQVRRAGVEDRLLMLPETPEIDTIYGLADALVLTSRLDPLPNVAIDAMMAGLPVLCFDQTTGIADTLAEAGLAAECVAPYLDVTALAERVVRLASTPDLYDEVARHSRATAERQFDFPAYTRRIEALALGVRREDPAEAQAIADSPHFDPDFCLGRSARGKTRIEAAAEYARRIRTGVSPRRPEPGFHPYVFLDHMHEHLDTEADPYAAFLAMGRPEGAWLSPVIEGGPAARAPSAVGTAQPLRAALHVHAYFPEVLPDLISRLSANASRPTLFVSVPGAEELAAAREHLAHYSGPLARLEQVPNCGRDIGPFLTAFGAEMVADHDVVGHVHTKHSRHVEDAEVIADWVELAMSGVLGGPRAGPMLDRILERLSRDADLGLVYPADPHLIGWTNNLRQAKALAGAMGHEKLPHNFGFPIGTMFWMRSAALRPFIELGLRWQDYPSEPLDIDGTSLHALERLFGVVPVLNGWTAAVTHTPGITR
ncbi:MAG: rhamnan synthesis F family protein [Alkalilacustris sp.]